MKQILQLLGMVSIMLMSFLSASSYDFEVDGIYYNILSVKDFTCEVTGSPNKYAGMVKIPSAVSYKSKDLAVVAIGDKAFEDCADLEGVEIPESVTTIGSYAFKGCGFETFEIPNSIQELRWTSGIFKDCKNITNFNWPDRFTQIPESTFEGCTNLKTITIPSSVTEISTRAFKDCVMLNNIELSASINDIGGEAFMGCKSLKSMLMPNVKGIGTDAFSNCIELREVGVAADVNATYKIDPLIHPNKYDRVGHIFRECTNLHKLIVYPRSFKDDYSIPSILYRTCHEWISDIDIQELDLQSMYISKSKYERTNSQTIEFRMYGNSIETIKLNYSVLRKQWNEDSNDWFYIWEWMFDVCKNLKCIILSNEDPDAGPSLYSFTDSQYINVEVYVPDEAYETYAQTEPWKFFWNLKRMSEYSGTHDITTDVDPLRTIVNRYDLNGRVVPDNYKGIVIVLFSDGTTKKIVQN